MKLTNFILLIFLVFGFLSIPGSVFAEENSVTSSASFLDVSPSNVLVIGFVPVLKGVKVSGDDIEAFLNAPLEQQIFAILAAIIITIFIAWYFLKGRYMKLTYRIPIVLGMLLAIFILLYLLGNMMFFIVVVLVAIIVLAAIWYEAHGKAMGKTRLAGTLIGICLLMGLIASVPGYYYFTAADDIIDVTVSSQNSSLEIIDYKAYRLTFSGTEVEFGGHVKNNGDASAEYVKINATGYDAYGKIVANDTTYADDDTIAPGATSPFGYLSNKFGGSFEDPQKRIVRVKLEIITTKLNF
jgi:hypothetical protein